MMITRNVYTVFSQTISILEAEVMEVKKCYVDVCEYKEELEKKLDKSRQVI